MLLCDAFAALALSAEAGGPISVYPVLILITRHSVQIHVSRDAGSGLIRDFL